MLTIQSVMLVLLGFLSAILVVFVLSPAYRRRVERQAVDALKRSLPMTQAEINAERDRLRAEYAIRIHKLGVKVREAEAAGARQLIDLNRRDARVGALEVEIENLKADLEENTNARLVLEQTIRDRLPKVEQRLVEAKKLIFNRDRDIAALTGDGERTVRALDEAMQINAQQRAELSRLKAIAATAGVTSYGALVDPKHDAEVAFRAEIESLRAQLADQSALIERLRAGGQNQGQVERSKVALLEAERQKREPREAADAVAVSSGTDGTAKTSLEGLKARNEQLTAEVKRLTAALQAYEAPADDGKSFSVRDSKIALKARVGSLQAQVESQGEAVRRLRAELATANERLARQAAHFMEEMRRIGTGSLPASPPARRLEAPVQGVRERIARANPTFAEQMAPPTEYTPPRNVAQAIKTLGGAEEVPAGGEPGTAPEERRRGRLIDRIADIGKS